MTTSILITVITERYRAAAMRTDMECIRSTTLISTDTVSMKSTASMDMTKH